MYTHGKLKNETGCDLSRSTYRRTLRLGVLNWLAKKRQALKPYQARTRLAFAQLHRHKDWSNTLFSDECSVEKGVGKKRLWVGHPSQKWDTDKIQTYNNGPGTTVVVCACAGASLGVFDLVVVKRDETAPGGGGGNSTWSYVEALEKGLIPVSNSSRMAHGSIRRSLRIRRLLIGV